MNRILQIGEYGTKNYLDPDELISHCEDGRLYRDADGALMLNARTVSYTHLRYKVMNTPGWIVCMSVL